MKPFQLTTKTLVFAFSLILLSGASVMMGLTAQDGDRQMAGAQQHQPSNEKDNKPDSQTDQQKDKASANEGGEKIDPIQLLLDQNITTKEELREAAPHLMELRQQEAFMAKAHEFLEESNRWFQNHPEEVKVFYEEIIAKEQLDKLVEGKISAQDVINSRKNSRIVHKDTWDYNTAEGAPFPKFIKTGHPQKDRTKYRQAKDQWIQNNPEQYKKMGGTLPEEEDSLRKEMPPEEMMEEMMYERKNMEDDDPTEQEMKPNKNPDK